jgi:hypothetical protein
MDNFEKPGLVAGNTHENLDTRERAREKVTPSKSTKAVKAAK